jgi:hypothetical protein
MAGSAGATDLLSPSRRAGCRRGADDARDNRAHDEELSPTALTKRFALNEWQQLTGLR